MTIEFDATSYNTAGTTSTQIIGSVDGNSFEFTASANSKHKKPSGRVYIRSEQENGQCCKNILRGAREVIFL